MSARVAVVGAGIAGLACARSLRERGVAVTLFDKGRSVGGRVATRREGAHSFDLGAPHFTAYDARFAREVERWLDGGACARWRGRFVTLDGGAPVPEEHDDDAMLVGTPDMSAIARHMARGLDARTSHRVERIVSHGERLVLHGTASRDRVTLPPAPRDADSRDELGRFDWVVLAMPPSQAATLVEPVSASLSTAARCVEVDPCFALGLLASGRDAEALRALPFDGARVRLAESPLSWIARDSSKPGRPEGERWVLHASPSWSRAAFDAPEHEVIAGMLRGLAALSARGALQPDFTVLRRWAFARSAATLGAGSLHDERARVSLGGDWAADGRVEGAFLSGLDLAAGVLAALERTATRENGAAVARAAPVS